MTVVGWVGCFDGIYPVAPVTEERKKALAERIKKREYNFTHQSHQFMPYAAPLYDDGAYCEFNKKEWDEVMALAYGEMALPSRLMPQDAITLAPVENILFEKEKFRDRFVSERSGEHG